MRNTMVCLCTVVVLSLFFIQAAQADRADAILNLFIKKGLITQQDVAELENELEMEGESAKTELKVAIKEELAEEGLPLSAGGRFKVYGEIEAVGYTQDNTNFTKKQSVSFAENVAKIGVDAEFTEQVSGDFRIAAVNTSGDDSGLFNTSSMESTIYV